MLGRLDRRGWLALLLLVGGAAAVAVGLWRMTGSFDGGTTTSAVGAPAYAALFTFEVSGRHWLATGVLLIAIAGLGALLARRPRATRRLRVISGLLLAGLVALAIGLLRLPLGGERLDFGPGEADLVVNVSPPGALLALLGTLAVVGGTIVALRARGGS